MTKIFGNQVSSVPVRWWNPDGCWGIYHEWDVEYTETGIGGSPYYFGFSSYLTEEERKENLEERRSTYLKYTKEEEDSNDLEEGQKSSFYWQLKFLDKFKVCQTDVEKVSSYSTDFYAAFWIIQNIVRKEWVFSKRRKFFDALKNRFPTTDGSALIGWPDALMYLKAEDICIAALEVVGCEVKLKDRHE